MENIISQYKKLKKMYDSGNSPLDLLRDITTECLNKIQALERLNYGTTDGKDYICLKVEDNISRPIYSDLFIFNPNDFQNNWNNFIDSIDSENRRTTLESSTINKTIYTAIMSFSVCFDLWKPKSRKTPGTHFEVLLGSILSQFMPDYTRSKHISLPDEEESVSTDIVFSKDNSGVVIPAKITTRERIVQPYAHQRILDSVFGQGRYQSILICVSETQRDDKNQRVNNICVPGTLKLFQKHLSNLSGLFYGDPPLRYCNDDITQMMPVDDYATFFQTELSNILDSQL